MSGRKNQVNNVKLITAGDASGNLTSTILNIQGLDNIGIQCDLTGSPTGTINVQVSLNHAEAPVNTVLNAGTWVTLTTQAITAGSPNPVVFDLNQLSAPFLRVTYTFTSGTGTLTAVASGKMV